MMLTIHGFPPNTKYQDVKSLLSQQVNISDYILDNLVGEPDGRTKKVRVGLADDSEGYKLVNTLDGYRIQGFMLKVVPIGKPASKPSSQTFDSRPSYPNQPQNAFPNQQRNEYSNQQRNDFVQPSNDWGPNNRGPHGTGPHNASTQVPAGGPIPRGRPQSQGGPGGPNRPSGPFNQGGPAGPSGPRGHTAGGPPQITIDRSTQWGPNTSANQWGGQNRPMGSQGPQNSLGYNVEPNNNPPYSQQHSNQPSSEMRSFGRPQEQSFGGFPKNNVSEPMTTRQAPQGNRGRTLRSVETETGGPMHNRFVPVQNYPQHDKPIPIMKDNFQAPSQYTVNSTGGHAPMYQGPGSSAPWPQQGQQNKPIAPFDKQYDQGKYGPERDQGRPGTDMQRRHSPNTRRMSPPGRRISPSGRRFSPPGRRISPSGRKYSPPGRRMSPSGRRMSPPGRMMSPTGRRISPPSRAIPPSGRHSPTARGVPPGRHISPAGKRNSPPGRRISPPGRRLSPSGRRMSPSGRRMSPSGRRISPPLRRMSPSVRRISPSGRRMSPSGRRISPPLRRISPSGRMISLPGRRLSPSDRRISPTGKRISPNDRRLPVHHPARRESPPRRGDIQPRPGMARHDSPPRQPRSSPGRPIDKGTDYEKIKKIRPAYESVPSQAPNQAMYSGGYRPGDHDNVQYPATRPERRSSPWQRDNSAPIKKQDDDRREMARMPPRSDDPTRSHSSTRKSRSPIRRERSPIQPSRFKRLSPSSRSSRSPRRSWALEKRRSPEISDAPPPPIWPGQSSHADEYSRPGRPSFTDRKEDKPKHTPVWERPDGFDRRPDGDHRRPIGDRRQFSDEKVRAALAEREILAVRDSERDRFAPTQPKFSPRDYDAERRDHRHRNSPDRKPRDIDITRRPEHDDRRDDFHHRREPSPLRDKKPAILESIDKDFESIYSRTMQFKKKAEEMRKIHKREGYLEEERSHDRDREDTLRYEDRNRHERDREDRPRFEPRVEDEHRYRSRDENREHIQNTERPLRFHMSPSVRAKREKAIEDIAMKILERSDDYRDVKGEQKLRILEELKLGVARIVYDMFGDSDVSFIEVVVKYQARYNAKDEAQLLEDVIKSLPSHMRVIKRHAPGAAEVPAKLARRSASPTSKENTPAPKVNDAAQWNMAANSMVSQLVVPSPMEQPPMVPMMVQAPYMMQNFDILPQSSVYIPDPVPVPYPDYTEATPRMNEDDFKLYLCQDDFEQFTDTQAEYLKSFLFAQMVRESENGGGWMPEFNIKGLQSMLRYELLAKDERSRDWILNLDFSEFEFFNVLVYNKEELWYERAAVWLPGHSRVRNIEPLDKLKLQNKKLEGVNINKWKFVKKIVNAKGTRLYVDMPPSSARALEKHKLMLSYELQQVNVFLKALAVDKDVFDSGMKECSYAPPAELAAAVQNSPMPSIADKVNCVKITLKGSKTLSIGEARKIKEVVIYKLFEYHLQNGVSKTDFVKYGFYQPNYFGIVPHNKESERWLLGRHLGKVNRQAIVVMGAPDENTRYFKMTISTNREKYTSMNWILEKLKLKYNSMKGFNFNLWRPLHVTDAGLWSRHNKRFEVDIDLESVETLSKLKYKLEFVVAPNLKYTASFQSTEYSTTKLEETIKKCKAEMTDSYDVANMDLESDDSDAGVICLD